MTNDDIIRMALEAGIVAIHAENATNWAEEVDALERFAALVAAAEQKKWQDQTVVEIHEAVLDEREACAKVCREIMDDHWTGDDRWETARHCSEMILERGKK